MFFFFLNNLKESVVDVNCMEDTSTKELTILR